MNHRNKHKSNRDPKILMLADGSTDYRVQRLQRLKVRQQKRKHWVGTSGTRPRKMERKLTIVHKVSSCCSLQVVAQFNWFRSARCTLLWNLVSCEDRLSATWQVATKHQVQSPALPQRQFLSLAFPFFTVQRHQTLAQHGTISFGQMKGEKLLASKEATAGMDEVGIGPQGYRLSIKRETKDLPTICSWIKSGRQRRRLFPCFFFIPTLGDSEHARQCTQTVEEAHNTHSVTWCRF